MRRIFILICIAAQVLVLVVMAGEREIILGTGETAYLRTAPIDPRDPFRGDFVRLHYEISQVSPSQLGGGLPDGDLRKGDRIYAVLSKGAGGIYHLDHVTDRKPGQGVFLRGRLRRHWRAAHGSNRLAVSYGIEQLFVEQGRGRDIEQRRGSHNSLQVPMEVEVAVGSGGTAVIRDFRWSRLGMRLKMLRVNQRGRNTNLDGVTEPLSPKLEVSLWNASDGPLVVVDPGSHCGFRMRTTARVSRTYRHAYDGCRDVRVSEADLIELGPGQNYTVELDLSEPRWHMTVEGHTGEIGRYANNDSFRIVYQPPAAALAIAGYGVWEGELPSTAFTAFRLLD